MNTATARPLHAPSVAPAPRPHITIAPTRQQRRARPTVAYAMITVVSLLAVFGGQLLLSIAVSDGAYQLESLASDRKDLQRSERALREDLAVLSSDQNLATQAAGLGMVPNGEQYGLHLADGSVFRLPGMPDPTGCGGRCNLVTNQLTTGVPPVTAAPPAGQTAQQGAQQAVPTTPAGVVDVLPSPQTR